MCILDVEDFIDGLLFYCVLWDDVECGYLDYILVVDDKIKCVVMCFGKVYYDLLEECDKCGLDDVYLLCVE